jgi:hypothetical protein
LRISLAPPRLSWRVSNVAVLLDWIDVALALETSSILFFSGVFLFLSFSIPSSQPGLGLLAHGV